MNAIHDVGEMIKCELGPRNINLKIVANLPEEGSKFFSDYNRIQFILLEWIRAACEGVSGRDLTV